MKLIKTLLASIALFSCLTAYAVTDKEMEQARTTTAKIYLRWSNNMSGYLDGSNPTTMAELEGLLREEETKNLQAFKNAGVPSNYAGWDKDQLVTYWSQTFFENAKGLTEKGSNQGARGRIKSELKKIKVADPQEAAATPAPVPGEQTSNALTPDNGQGGGYAERIQETKDALSSNNEEGQEEQPVAKEKSGSSTWVYILILVILVIAVILLVMYASRTMKGGASNSSRGGYKPRSRKAEYDSKPRRDEEEKSYPSAEVIPLAARRKQEVAQSKKEDEDTTAKDASKEIAKIQQHYDRRLSNKQEEIETLNRRVNELEKEVEELSDSLMLLRKENERLHKEKEEAKAVEVAHAMREEKPTPVAKPQPVVEKTAPAPETNRAADIKEIYLGKVNSNGVFVRADRTFSPGNSVYKLVTTDGYSGTFRVVDNRTLEMLALERPEEFLAGGCNAKNINDTIGRTSIITDSSGTAIFEDGKWRVIRKADIHYD